MRLSESRKSGVRLADTAERTLFLQGQMAARGKPKQNCLRDLAEAEFRDHSQWGEDGMI